MRTAKWACGWAAAAAFSVGCVGEQTGGAERLAVLESEGRVLTHAAEALEARLLNGQSQVQRWAELAERHRSVSAIACKVSDSHLQGISRHLENQSRKLRQRETSETVSAVVASAARTPRAAE